MTDTLRCGGSGQINRDSALAPDCPEIRACPGCADCADTLRELDAAIAHVRGWERSARGEWWQQHASDEEARMAWAAADESEPLSHPPPFSSSWALAGPLLESMCRTEEDMGRGIVWAWDGKTERMGWWAGEGAAGSDEFGMGGMHRGATPCEAIARAYLAWRSKA